MVASHACFTADIGRIHLGLADETDVGENTCG